MSCTSLQKLFQHWKNKMSYLNSFYFLFTMQHHQIILLSLTTKMEHANHTAMTSIQSLMPWGHHPPTVTSYIYNPFWMKRNDAARPSPHHTTPHHVTWNIRDHHTIIPHWLHIFTKCPKCHVPPLARRERQLRKNLMMCWSQLIPRPRSPRNKYILINVKKPKSGALYKSYVLIMPLTSSEEWDNFLF